MVKFKEKSSIENVKFVDSNKLYKQFINPKSLLVKIRNLVDFDLYLPIFEDLYSDFGRDGHNPILMFKLCLLQRLNNHNEREVIEHSKVNLEYRYFLDLAIDDNLPHFTKLGTFRKRLGKEKFEEIFYTFVNNLKEIHIITELDIRLMDVTHQLADVSQISINTLLSQSCEELLKSINTIKKYIPNKNLNLEIKDFHLSDKEKKERFVNLIELGEELKIVAKSLLEEYESLELQENYNIICRIIKERSKVENDEIIRENNKDEKGKIASLSDKDATWGSKSKSYQFLGFKHNVTSTEKGFIEAISTKQGHISDEEFLPEDIKRIDGKKIVADSKYGTLKNRELCLENGIQLVSPLRGNVKSHLTYQIMEDAFQYNKTEEYKRDMKKRSSVIEGCFGVLKRKHSFGRAKYRGLEKVSIEGLISAFIVNLKALVKWWDIA